MTACRATVTLSRATLRATTAVSPAAIVCISADFFCLPVCSKATDSISPPKSGVFLFQPIERGVQVRDNGVGLISNDYQLDIDLFV